MVEVTYRIKGYRSKWVVKASCSKEVIVNLTNNRGAFIVTEGKLPVFDYFHTRKL